MRTLRLVLALTAVLGLAACEIERGGSTDSAAAGADTMAAGAVAGTGADSAGLAPGGNASVAQAAADSAALELFPERPRRGGVVWARLSDVGAAAARCTLDGAVIPCSVEGGQVLVVVPLPADEPARMRTLTVEAGGRRGTRNFDVAEHDFGRELVFLDSVNYARVRDRRAIARDARAVRAVLAAYSPERRWGRVAWGAPRSQRSSAYGVERFYYRASDSSRAIRLASDARARATFGSDTGTAPAGGDEVPSWRHSGVDLPLPRGMRVVAPAAATVADVGDYHLTGRTLLLDHGQGIFSAFFHLDTITVRRGDEVEVGQAVARVGSTGLTTGPHLHYGVYVHGRDVDPVAWREMPVWLREMRPTP